ncbi:MAG TPA: hypothetical protein VJL81_06275 [Solirubrobacterales bacterium]|nr:hypothetical protein [Solirubrobacterales bacterium]
MTLTAVWCSYEDPYLPLLWMASDSRISAGDLRLIDEGIKIFEVPVVCKGPGESGFFDQTYLDSSVGLACAGGTLVFQQVYGTLVPILGNLISPVAAVPTLRDIAMLIGRVLTIYVRSLGGSGRQGADRVAIIVGGQLATAAPEAYELGPREGSNGMIHFSPTRLGLGDGDARFIGDRVEEAQSLFHELVAKDDPGASRHRAPLNVIRAFVDDPQARTIGGEVQIGHTLRGRFRRVASIVPDRPYPAGARRLLNSIDLDQLGQVGECVIGTEGMVSP